MLFAVDVGNTNTVFAVFSENIKVSEWRCSTNNLRTADEYFVWLKNLMDLANIDFKQIKSVIVCSVVPKVVFNLRILASRYFSCRPMVVGKTDCMIPIDVRVDNGVMVGSDRIVNSVGAFNRYGGNLIVLDFGTATTFDVINQSGSYVGGVIAPGVSLSTKALHEAAAALPHVEVKRPPNVVGRNTIDCMQSGIYWGYLSLVEGMISKIKKEKRIRRVIATGGLSSIFSQDTSMFDKIDLRLTIKGLVYISSFNED